MVFTDSNGGYDPDDGVLCVYEENGAPNYYLKGRVDHDPSGDEADMSDTGTYRLATSGEVEDFLQNATADFKLDMAERFDLDAIQA